MNTLMRILNGNVDVKLIPRIQITEDNLKIHIGIDRILWARKNTESPFVNRKLWHALLWHNHYVSEENEA